MEFFIKNSADLLVVCSMIITVIFLLITLNSTKKKFAAINVPLLIGSSKNENAYILVTMSTVIVFFINGVLMIGTRDTFAVMPIFDRFHHFIAYGIFMSIILMTIWPPIAIAAYKAVKWLQQKRQARIIRLASEFNKTHQAV